MSTLESERAAIAEIVRAAYAEYGEGEYGSGLYGDGVAFVVHEYVPGRLVPPAAIVTPSDPYLERRQGDPFGTLTAAFEVWIVTTSSANDVATKALDELIEQIGTGLTRSQFAMEKVSEPFMYAVQNGNYLTAIINVTTGVTFT